MQNYTPPSVGTGVTAPEDDMMPEEGMLCTEKFKKCGGKFYKGPTCCQGGFECRYKTEFLSICARPMDM